MCVLITRRKLNGTAQVNDAVQFRAEGARASEILPLPRRQIWHDFQRNVRDRIDNVGPENRSARLEFVVESSGAQSSFSSSEPLGTQQRIVLGERCPLTEAAVEFVQSWRAKCAVARKRRGNIASEIANHREPWTEGCFIAVGKIRARRSTRRQRQPHRASVEVAPIVPADADDDHPSISNANNVLPENSNGALPPSGDIVREVKAGGGGEQLLVAGSNHLVCVGSGNQRLARKQVIPLQCCTQLLRRDVLNVGKVLDVSTRRDGRKCLIVALGLTVGAGANPIVSAERCIQASDAEAGAGIVLLNRCAVVSRLIEESSSQKGAAGISNSIADARINRGMLGVRGGVDKSSLRLGRKNVSIGPGQIRGGFHVPRANCCAGPRGKVGGAFVAVRDID